ncbi:MAG TPA: carboxylesterase family protein [Kofleriaceae bacterium]|nr:carboxylesterase family protein [Kofleriaceae bacterium]
MRIRMTTCRRSLAIAALCLAACGDGDPGDPLAVEIDTGVLHGIELGQTRAFLGVPYAAPPVGPDRWRPPQPTLPWDGVRDAISVGIQCPQALSLSGPGGDEDCLFLNVWTPTSPGDDGLVPVMVWLHGGAFVFGSGGDKFYSGQHLAETYGVVVVTLSYRLGALGFLAHPALAAEDPAYPSSGNYGFDDQRAALGWVQRNIAQLGGDPGNVLLFGESAGGYSTCAHYVSPRSAGLFSRAIVESGLCTSPLLEATRAEAEATGTKVAQDLGCPATGPEAVACLRAKPVDALLAATALPQPQSQPPGGPLYLGDTASLLATRPSVDGFVVEQPMRAAFAAASFPPRPLIVGTTRDEGTLFHSPLFATEVTTDAEYRAALARRFGQNNVAAIVARYPASAFASPNRALAEVSGDAFFVCPARQTARDAAAAGAPVYLYSFEQPPELPLFADLGVFHSAEIPFVFGTDPAYPLGRVGESGAATAATLQALWTQFAAAADPNGVGPAWPAFERAGDRHLVIGPTIAAGSGHKAAACDFWDVLLRP